MEPGDPESDRLIASALEDLMETAPESIPALIMTRDHPEFLLAAGDDRAAAILAAQAFSPAVVRAYRLIATNFAETDYAKAAAFLTEAVARVRKSAMLEPKEPVVPPEECAEECDVEKYEPLPPLLQHSREILAAWLAADPPAVRAYIAGPLAGEDRAALPPEDSPADLADRLSHAADGEGASSADPPASKELLANLEALVSALASGHPEAALPAAAALPSPKFDAILHRVLSAIPESGRASAIATLPAPLRPRAQAFADLLAPDHQPEKP